MTEHKTPKFVLGTKFAKIKQPKQTDRIIVVKTSAGTVWIKTFSRALIGVKP